MAARGVQKWNDRVKATDILPVAWDRDNSSAEDSTPFCLTIKTIEGLIPKVDLGLINRKENRYVTCLFLLDLESRSRF